MSIIALTIITASALLLALDSVISEGMMSAFGISPLAIAGVPALLGGILLFLANPTSNARSYQRINRASWTKIALNGACSAAALFLWFDSVARIGAGKEMLLSSGTTETLFILLLSFLFLRERLSAQKLFGSAIILLGVFLVLFRPHALDVSVGFGDAEAMFGALFFAIAVTLAADVLKSHEPRVVGSLYLMIEGVLLVLAATVAGEFPSNASSGTLVGFVALGVIVALAVVTYNIGLQKVGASLTAVVSSFSGVFAVGLQLLSGAIVPSAPLVLPPSIMLAMTGGIIAVFGVFLISKEPSLPHPPEHTERN